MGRGEGEKKKRGGNMKQEAILRFYQQIQSEGESLGEMWVSLQAADLFFVFRA